MNRKIKLKRKRKTWKGGGRIGARQHEAQDDRQPPEGTGPLQLRTGCRPGPPWGLCLPWCHWLLGARKMEESRIRGEVLSQVSTKKLTKLGKGGKFARHKSVWVQAPLNLKHQRKTGRPPAGFRGTNHRDTARATAFLTGPRHSPRDFDRTHSGSVSHKYECTTQYVFYLWLQILVMFLVANKK